MAASGQDALQLGDGLRVRASTMLASGTVPDRIFVIRADATSGAITLNMPPVASVPGQLFLIKKIDSSTNQVTIDGDGTETIDGALTQALTTQYEAIFLISDGTQWWLTDPVASGDFDGLFINQPADASGTPPVGLKMNAGAHTNVANAEQLDINLNLARTVTFADGAALSTQRAMLIQAPTYASALAKTITNAATLAISGAPVQGTNVTLTNTYALWVQGGSSRFDGTSPILLPDTTGFNNGIQFGGAQKIAFDAANATGLRNGTTAQTFSVYNTFTAGTPDYERLEMLWSGNVCIIRTNKNGTGTARALNINYSTGAAAIQVGTGLNGGLILGPNGGSSASQSSGGVILLNNQSFTTLSGSNIGVQVNPSYSDGGTTSTTVYSVLSLAPTVNYTAASKTGKVVLAYFNPTLTSQPSGNNAGISFSSAFTSSTFPAMRFHNVADEDTNYENLEMGWHISTNVFGIRMTKGGTGTARSVDLNYPGGTNIAFRVPSSSLASILIAATGTVSSALNQVVVGNNNNVTATSGTHQLMLLNHNPAPTSTSTMAFRSLSIAPTINYSNGTPGAGSVYCAYIAPVNTALPTGLNAGLALSSTASALTGAVLFFNQADEITNFEYVSLGFASNVFTIGSVKGGTGTLRGIAIGVTSNAVGFMGATPVVRQASAADLTNNVTAGGVNDTIANYTDLTVYTNDAAAIRNDIYQLSRKLKQVNDAMRLYGLLT